MSRALTSIVLLTVLSTNVMGQSTEDPVARMTSDIISRYTGGVSSSSFSRSYTADMDQIDRQQLGLTLREIPATPLPRLSPWQSPFKFSLPWFSPRLPEIKEGLRMDMVEPAPSRLPLPVDTFAAYAARPLSLSTASANGIHAVDAIVATENGEERVELKGTRKQLKRQLKAFSPQAQRVMTRSLGL